MLIIWRGAGAAVILFGILGALLTNIVTSSFFHEDNYFAQHAWAQAVGLWVAGAACWFLGKYLHSKPGRVLVDKATGQEVVLKPIHSLFFIKMEFWGPILFVIGLCVLVIGSRRR
jgi:hypothetical protein